MSAHPPFEHSSAAAVSAIPPGLMVENGSCYIVRKSPGCGCCPEEAKYYGPWLSKEGAEAFALCHQDQKENRNRNFTVAEVPYVTAGRFIIIKDHYATENAWADNERPEHQWSIELEDFERIYGYV